MPACVFSADDNSSLPFSVRQTREYFPRGLHQPAGSFRFSADALLLASFLQPEPGARLLDIGTGCGVVALAMLRAHPHARACGLDREPPLLAAAEENARRLGFTRQFTTVRADLANAGLFGAKGVRGLLQAGSFDLALANPPFRQPEKGRLPQSPLRRAALFEEKNTLELFCACAFRAVKQGGRFGILYTAERQEYLLRVVKAAGFTPVRVLPVQTRPDKPPIRVLLEASRLSPHFGML